MLIAGWDKWQTYRKDRGTPPWIKVYRNLFSNEDWAALNDSEKGQLVSLWILAADKHGVIPDDPKVLQKMCMLDSPPKLSKFKDLGFLVTEWLPGGDQVVSEDEDLDLPETETETETEVYSRVFVHWNSLKIITHREIKKFLPFIKARLENYSEKDITEAMDNYSKIVKGPEYFWTHRWTLEDFLSRKKALDQFLTENDPFSNYRKDKAEGGEVVPDDHPKRNRILLLARIISKTAGKAEQDKFAQEHNDISYDAMRQRASDEREELLRDK